MNGIKQYFFLYYKLNYIIIIIKLRHLHGYH